MIHLEFNISIRSVVFILLLGVAVFAGSDVARGAPSAVPLTDADALVFTNPGQNNSRDIRTTGSEGDNLGGIRIYADGALTNPPQTAALQFFGNGHSVFPGQAFIDSGSHANAAILFRTSASGGVAERMRVTANGRVGIGTTTPTSSFQVVGNFVQIPAGAGAPNTDDCNELVEAGRMVVRTDGTTSLYVCNGLAWFVPNGLFLTPPIGLSPTPQ